MLSQHRRAEKLRQHSLVLYLRQTYQIRHTSIPVAHPHDALGYSVAFGLKFLPAPVPAPVRGELLVGLPRPLIDMIKKILQIPEHHQ